MADSPFQDLLRRSRWRGRLRRWRDLIARPLRPTRIQPDRTGPANLLLIGVDTLRADHLGLAGCAQPTSQNLDSLAGRGTTFADTTAASPWTLPSFATALTGLMPGLHGGFLPGTLRNMDDQPPQPLDARVTTLAGHLRRQGYRTAAFYSNQFFAFGLAESFDHHVYRNLPAQELAREALDWIRCHGDRPFFCFLLCNDPHEPTTPTAEDLAPFLTVARSQGADTSDRAVRHYARWGDGPAPQLGLAAWPLDTATRQGLLLKKAIYNAAICQVDRALGEIHEQMRQWDLDRSTVFSVFADHGEEFLDHAEFAHRWNHDPRKVRGIGHGHTHFKELLHVPWVVWGPGVPVGVRYRDPVSLLDLTPTLLDWLGLEPLDLGPVTAKLAQTDAALAAALVGHSLAPVVIGVAGEAATEGTADRILLSEAIAYGPDLVAVRRGRWKLIAHRDGRPLALFDLATDTEETRDLQNHEADVVAEMLELVHQWRQTGTGAHGDDTPGSTSSWQDVDDTVRQRLKDLGYSD